MASASNTVATPAAGVAPPPQVAATPAANPAGAVAVMSEPIGNPQRNGVVHP